MFVLACGVGRLGDHLKESKYMYQRNEGIYDKTIYIQ